MMYMPMDEAITETGSSAVPDSAGTPVIKPLVRALVTAEYGA
jgi:NAD kinase